jgi:LysR family nod box-dependent transcriptional activator
MRINRLDLNQLTTLDALLTEANVSKAAIRVHLSQPAVSAALAKFREFFGDLLLVPNGRVLSLTPFARALVSPVHDLLLQAQALSRLRPQTIPSRFDRKITVAASDYAFIIFLLPMLRRAEIEAPGLSFELRPLMGSITEELDRGDVDMVVSLASGASPRHPSEVIFADTFSSIVWKDNPLVGKTLTKKLYLELGHVVMVLGNGRVPTLDQLAMEAAGLERKIEVRVPGFTLIPACVAGSKRIGTMQTTLAHMLAEHLPLRVMHCPIPIPAIQSSMQWHSYQTRDPAIQWTLAAIRDLARELGSSRKVA